MYKHYNEIQQVDWYFKQQKIFPVHTQYGYSVWENWLSQYARGGSKSVLINTS